VRELLSRDIGAVGLQGIAVASFGEAHTCLQLSSYSLAIVDGSLPGCLAFIEEIGQTVPGLRIILTSVLGTVADLDAENVVINLVKPIRRWRLFKALEKALSESATVNMKDADDISIKEIQRQALANMAYRHTLRILLAEDNPINTKVALQHLRRMGYTADHAKDGLEVLELCERAALADSLYDVILLDIQMPNMDGYEATRILRQRYEDGVRPTLVALTANATSSDKERSLEAGLDGHISKPILPDLLAGVLASVKPKRKR